MVKVYFKNPSMDATKVLTVGRRVLALFLDEWFRIPKIFKSHKNTTPKDIFMMKIKRKKLKMVKVHKLLAKIVFMSFYKG